MDYGLDAQIGAPAPDRDESLAATKIQVGEGKVDEDYPRPKARAGRWGVRNVLVDFAGRTACGIVEGKEMKIK